MLVLNLIWYIQFDQTANTHSIILPVSIVNMFDTAVTNKVKPLYKVYLDGMLALVLDVTKLAMQR